MSYLIGCPMHDGVSDAGLCRSISTFQSLFPEFQIHVVPEADLPDAGLPNLKNLPSVTATCEALAAAVDGAIRREEKPIVLGGDHALAIGSISGSAAVHRQMGVLWIDSHSDINTDQTTVTGNIHGMPVSAVLGLGEKRLTSVYGAFPKVLARNVVMFGVRDMDPLEVELVRELGVRVFTYDEVMSLGLPQALQLAKAHLSETDGIHVSFDLDVMDPTVIKGVTVPVAGGFCPEDVLHLFELLPELFSIVSMDLVEYNPVYDSDGFTGEFLAVLLRRAMQFLS